jgi:hypothetical protein
MIAEWWIWIDDTDAVEALLEQCPSNGYGLCRFIGKEGKFD